MFFAAQVMQLLNAVAKPNNSAASTSAGSDEAAK
jgi:hypothetical protein